MVGKDRIGSILIQTSTCKDGYCSQALEALVAFGKSIGPLYQSVSAVERMVLKQGYVSDEREEAISLNGNSDAMRAVFQAMQAATRSELPVLIQGESGSGKEGISKSLREMMGKVDFMDEDMLDTIREGIERERRRRGGGKDDIREG